MLDLDTLTLDRGCHESREDGVCLLEAVAWWAGEPHSDHPRCVSPVLAEFGRLWNDALDDEWRQRLVPLVPRLVGTAGDGHDEARAWMAVDWLARVQAPAWLRLIERHDLASALEHCAPVRSIDDARAAQPGLDEAFREAQRAWDTAWDAAWEAAWAAARKAGLDAAWTAARNAAWRAAWGAAAAAARDAAQEPAWAAAWDAAAAAAAAAALDAALDAARDAVRGAVGDPATAAREAATARLRPTARALQESALDLFARMISLGEDQRTPATPAGAIA